MGNFAVIKGDTVVNVIIADSKEVAEQVAGNTCIDYGNQPVGVGLKYDFKTQKFQFPTGAFDFLQPEPSGI